MSRLTHHYDEEVGMVLVVRRTQRARVDYTCAECGGTIEKGEVHIYEWNVCDGSGVNIRRHAGGCYADEPDTLEEADTGLLGRLQAEALEEAARIDPIRARRSPTGK